MDKKFKWDLEAMYSSKEEIEKDFSKIEKLHEKVIELKKNPKENLKKLIILEEEISRITENVWVYAHMKKDEDSNVVESQKLDMRIQALGSKVFAEFSFLNPLILSLDEEESKKLLEDKELERFKLNIQKILRYRPHTLTDKEEFIISSYSPTVNAASEIYYYLTNTDMKFPKLINENYELKNNTFVELQMNKDRNLRKESFEKYYQVYKNFSNTIAASYYANIKAKYTTAKLKGFDSVRQMYLFTDDVDEKVYDSLIESVHQNLKYLHKYYEIKKRALNLEEQNMYDVYMPITTNFERKYTFEEAKKLVIDSVSVLGEEYVSVYKKAFDERWIDVEPRDGKRGGAYSSGTYDSFPYVLLNFNGTLSDVFTLAHEMGHSMHSYYARKFNTYQDHQYTIFVAEVASTFNEALLLDMLMKSAKNDEEKLYLVDFYLNSYKSTLFRQVMFAEFEREAHKKVESGMGLTAEDLNSLYLDLNKKYFGDAMISNEEIAFEWMRIPHFYSNFYVYKYATGFSASSILAQRVLNGEAGAIENYMEFLKDGSKHFPIDQLKIAGVDMSEPETVNKALEVFAKLVEELDKMIK